MEKYGSAFLIFKRQFSLIQLGENAMKSIAGKVPNPKTTIYKLLSITPKLVIAPITAKYTNTQGKSPLNKPIEKNAVKFRLEIKCCMPFFSLNS